MTPKRCICRRSSRYPLCDGTHTDKPWCTQTESSQTSKLVLATPSLQNLAEWWAQTIGGTTIGELTHPIQNNIAEVWILSDGLQFPLLQVLLQQLPHTEEYWVHTEDSPVLPNIRSHEHTQYHYFLPENFDLETLDPYNLPSINPRYMHNIRIFVSHAVADEAFLLPILHNLQGLHGIDFFICSAISSQADWYTEIETHLRQSDVVWAFLSTGFTQSTFCAFEIGMTRALRKPLQLFSIDTTLPPSYVQHQQVQSLLRVQKQMPWLTPSESLQHTLRKALSEIKTSV